jgi:hypothetical protein
MNMSEWVYLALGLGGIVAIINIPMFLWQRKDSRESSADLRALQLEIARENLASYRAHRRSHAELLAYMKVVGVRAEQIFERVDDR